MVSDLRASAVELTMFGQTLCIHFKLPSGKKTLLWHCGMKRELSVAAFEIYKKKKPIFQSNNTVILPRLVRLSTWDLCRTDYSSFVTLFSFLRPAGVLILDGLCTYDLFRNRVKPLLRDRDWGKRMHRSSMGRNSKTTVERTSFR